MNPFWSYLTRRAWQSVFVLLGLSVVVFGLLNISGDPIRLLAPISTTAEELEQLRKAYGMDRSVPERYIEFLLNAVRGDFGRSVRSGLPVLPLVLERLPATVTLAATALMFALLIAFPIGIVAALQRNTWVDRGLMAIALLGQSMPVFWLGILLILIFAVNLQILPATGTREGWKSLILPAITLGMFNMSRTARLLRSEMLDTLRADYVRTARSKGLPESTVLVRHALRNALIPIVTMIGLDLGALLAGSVITETIFAWPGIGRLAVDSIYARDFPVVLGVVFVIAMMYVGLNFIVDMIYVFLDPRVRLH